MKIIVTGGTGFIGSHLVDRLAARHDEICLWVRPGRGIAPHKSVTMRELDLTDAASVLLAMRDFDPDAIIHLAAQSLPEKSWQQPWETVEINVKSALNIYDAARAIDFRGPLLVAGSSSEYAAQSDPAQPIGENHPIAASSPYAASKIAADQLSQIYAKRYGLRIIRVRPFFWIGIRKTGDFCSDMASKLTQAAKTGADRIKVGNLNAVRDFLDVGDGVDALLLLLEQGRAGEAYNICSGAGRSLRDMLDLYLQKMPHPIEVDVDPALLRPLDEPVRIGDPHKIMALGWRPQRLIEATLGNILQYWKDKAG